MPIAMDLTFNVGMSKLTVPQEQVDFALASVDCARPSQVHSKLYCPAPSGIMIQSSKHYSGEENASDKQCLKMYTDQGC